MLFAGFCIGFSFCSACAQSPSASLPENMEHEVILLQNEAHVVPIAQVDVPIYYANVGQLDMLTFSNTLQKYAHIHSVSLNNHRFLGQKGYLIVTFGKLDTVIQSKYIAKLNALHHQNMKVIAVILQPNGQLKQMETAQFPFIWAPSMSSSPSFISNLAQVVMGGKSIKGVLSQNFSPKFQKGMGFTTQKTRLGYSDLTFLHKDTDALQAIDVIAQEAMSHHAAPGMNVLVVKNGEVVYEKAFGHYKYQDSSFIQDLSHVFDLASVTKIMATTPEVMRLVQDGKIHLTDKISRYLPEFLGKPAANVTIQEVLLHEAGFIPYIPFYKKLSTKDYASDSSAAFPTKVAAHYFLRKNYFSTVMWPEMISAPLKTRGKYVYSDISMYVMRAIIEKVTGSDLPEVLARDFYQPLGLQHTGFNPWRNEPIANITPTENDTYFRHQTLQGYVHDQGAAMAGGVSGHAGLFSTVNDMAIFYQMLLNGGIYGGKRYLDSAVITNFIKQFHESSRRGLGFDKREIEPDSKYPSQYATAELYGHTGYTGTCVWVDPKNDFIFIFLSNRVQPEVSTQLIKLKIRERMLDVVYQELGNSD